MDLPAEFSGRKWDRKELLPSSGGQANIYPERPIEVEFTHVFNAEAESQNFRIQSSTVESPELKTLTPQN